MKILLFSFLFTGVLCAADIESNAAFTMRIDDNHSVGEWERVAEIFESRGIRVSFAVVPSGLSDEQGACLRRLSERGHVIMDHTPNHTFYQATYHDRVAFDCAKGKPFVAEVDETKMKLYFRCEADENHPKNRRLRVRVAQNRFAFDSPKSVRGMYDFIKFPGDEAIYGLQKDKTTGAFELRDFWRRPLSKAIDRPEVEVILFDQAAIQPCDDVLRELAKVSRERFDRFGLPRPTIWVRPGGWDAGVSWDRLERVYGREFGYVGADSRVNIAAGTSRWSTGYDAMYFFDQGADITPERLVDQIQERLAKGRFHVTLSHMWSRVLSGGSDEWFAKTERFAQLLVDRKIPTLTMAESLTARFGEPQQGAAVVENAPGYNAWPMIQAVDGKLICTYSRGSGHSIGEDGTQTDAAVYVEPVSLPAAEKFQQNVVPAVHQVRRATETFGADPARASRRVAFVGNSITRHGPKPSIGWTNDCGMAASSVDKDYVHVCAAELERDVPGGTYRLVNVAGSLERSFMKPEWSPEKDFAGLKDFKPDVVVFFFGANVPKTYDADPSTAARNFGAAVESLARYLDTGHTQFLISEGFYIRPALDAEKKAAAERLGATFVKMDDIRRRDDAHGRFNHPSDTGMRLIAERFASVIRQVSSAPSCANLLAETRRVGSERPKIAVFGGSFSCIKPSEVAKRAWSEALDCDVENFGMGGMGFLRGAEKTNDIPNQVRKALATRNRYAAFVLWASTNDLRYPVEEQNASISNCVRLIREGSPESKVLFFASMPWPLNPENDAKLARLVDGQLETCRQLNVPCLDLYHDSGITAENAVHYTAADKHHPNAAGYAKVAPLQVGFLETHLPSLSWSYRFDDGSFAPIDLQAQIDAVAAQGGGRVDVPKGRWLTDPIELKSRVELHLSAGCELFFTDELEKYLPAVRTTYEGIECLNYRPLISAYGATQIAITGRGKIEPQMGRWETWRWNGPGTQQAKATLNEWGNRDVPVEERNLTKLPGAKTRPPFVEFNGCTDIRLEGFKLRNSPFWCIHLLDCDRAAVRGLSVSAFMNNSDGIDIECSRNVTVEDCSFDQGDDVIVLKSGKDRDGRRRATPTENVTIRRCRAGSGHGFLVAGSECSGGIRNVTMEDCLVDGSLATLFKVKTSPTRGGFVENLTMRRVTARTILDAVIDVKANYALNASAGDAEEVLTEIRGLTLEDISVGTANIRCDIQGDARRPVQDVRLANVTVGRCARADKIVHAEVVGK